MHGALVPFAFAMGLYDKLRQRAQARSQLILQAPDTEIVPEPQGVPKGLVIGVPAQWYSYGWPPAADWLRIERIYRTFPLVSAAIETLAEQAVGPGYYFDGDNADFVTEFADKKRLRLKALRTYREMALYGNCFWELRYDSIVKDPDDDFRVKEIGNLVDVKILPPTTMRVVPDPYNGADPAYGFVQLIYGQHIRFAPEQIAHFKINETGGQVGSDFYGMGLVQSSNDYIDAMKTMQEYMVRIMKRYAAPRNLWRYGDPNKPLPSADALTAIEGKLSKLGPDDDIVSDYLLDVKGVGADVRARLEEYVQHIFFNIILGLQNPNMTLTASQVRLSDASAKALEDTADRKVGMMQEGFTEVFEEQVCRRMLASEDIPEMHWGKVATVDPVDNFSQMTGLLTNQLITPETRFDIENKVRRLLELEPLDQKQMMPVYSPQAIQSMSQPKPVNDRIADEFAMTEKTRRNMLERFEKLVEAKMREA